MYSNNNIIIISIAHTSALQLVIMQHPLDF